MLRLVREHRRFGLQLHKQYIGSGGLPTAARPLLLQHLLDEGFNIEAVVGIVAGAAKAVYVIQKRRLALLLEECGHNSMLDARPEGFFQTG